MKYFVTDYGLYASGRWPTTKIGALREAIQKWKFISKHPGISDRAQATCACCHAAKRLCMRCLIFEAGYPACFETPYMEYARQPTAENARKEVRFLKRILKTNSPKASNKGKGEWHEKQD